MPLTKLPRNPVSPSGLSFSLSLLSTTHPWIVCECWNQEESILEAGVTELSFEECVCVILSKRVGGVFSRGNIQLCEGKYTR